MSCEEYVNYIEKAGAFGGHLDLTIMSIEQGFIPKIFLKRSIGAGMDPIFEVPEPMDQISGGQSINVITLLYTADVQHYEFLEPASIRVPLFMSG